MSFPLVAALCCTRNRRTHLPRAIKCFLAQDWPNKELVILDDGDDRVGDVVPPDPRIRYWRAGTRFGWSGPKRQTCLELAPDAPLLALWDDDDWHGPERLARQAEALLAKPEKEACLLNPVLFADLPSDEVWTYNHPGGCAVGTLMFRREYAARGPFTEHTGVTADAQFVLSKPFGLLTYADGKGAYMAVRHEANTSGWTHLGRYWSRADGSARRLVDDAHRW